MTAPPAPSLLVVVRRELVRNGRRWQTWALRTGFAAGLFVLVAVLWADRIPTLEAVDRVALGRTGGMLFRAFVGMQTVGLVAITPILVASAVIEERDGGTLQLLALTRLSPGQILWGKVLSRVLLLELVVLGGLPFLAVCSSLGGFGPLDLVNVFVQSTTMICSLAAVSCFLGLYSTGPFRPAMQTWFWTIGAWWLGGLPHAALQLDLDAWATVSPAVAMFNARGWQILGPPTAQLPVAAGVLIFAGAGLRAMLSGADDAQDGFGSLSQEFAGLRRVRRSMAWTIAAIVGLLPIVVFQKALGGHVALLGQLSVPWSTLWLWLGTVMYLLSVRWLLLRREAKVRRTPLKRWKQLSAEWDGGGPRMPATWTPLGPGGAGRGVAAGEQWEAGAWGAGPARASSSSSEAGAWEGASEAGAWEGASGSEVRVSVGPVRVRPVAAQVASLSGRAPRSADKVARSRRPFFAREVWSNPVLWREVATAAYGGLGGSLKRLNLGFAVLAGLLLFLGAFRVQGLALSAAACALTFATLATLLTATASVASELRHDTLGLLVSSRLSAGGILRSKLLATAAFAGPAWVAAVAFGLQGAAVVLEEMGGEEQALVLARWLGFSAWTGVVLVALAISCHSIGLRARTAPRVWIWTVMWSAWNVAGSLLLRFLVDGVEAAEFVAGVWNPLLAQDTWDFAKTPTSLAISTAVWAAFSAALFLDNTRRIRRHGH